MHMRVKRFKELLNIQILKRWQTVINNTRRILFRAYHKLRGHSKNGDTPAGTVVTITATGCVTTRQ